MKEIEQILDFMKIVEKLCLIKRDNKMSDGSAETDAPHILKLVYLVMFITPYLKTKVDYTRMLELALVHDLVEAEAGDVSLSAQNSHPELKELKHQNELKAITHFREMLPPELGNKIYDLFMEYENKSTREAKIVSALDKQDGHWQANQNQGGDIRYWADCDGGEWYYECALTKKPMVAELDEEIISELENAVMKISAENIEKCGIRATKKMV